MLWRLERIILTEPVYQNSCLYYRILYWIIVLCIVWFSSFPQVIVSPVLAGLAVAIGVPILLFYVYGVVPVSLCRAGCGEGTKFEFDEEEDNGSRNHGKAVRTEFSTHWRWWSINISWSLLTYFVIFWSIPDAASVDAVSRIGATSIGEVSLSVASGSHLGVSSQHSAYGVANPSTTALAGSITG